MYYDTTSLASASDRIALAAAVIQLCNATSKKSSAGFMLSPKSFGTPVL